MCQLNLARGDWLSVADDGDGSLRLSPLDPSFEEGTEIAERAIKTYRNALSEPAK